MYYPNKTYATGGQVYYQRGSNYPSAGVTYYTYSSDFKKVGEYKLAEAIRAYRQRNYERDLFNRTCVPEPQRPLQINRQVIRAYPLPRFQLPRKFNRAPRQERREQ